MKKTVLLSMVVLLTAAAMMSFLCAGEPSGAEPAGAAVPQEDGKLSGKALVAYFTCPETDDVDASSGASRVVDGGKLYGNTEFVAMIISKWTKGDLFAIKTQKTYPAHHQDLIDEAKREADSNERPRLSTHVKNIGDYDIVFVGYPNWWYDMPMAIYSFLDEYDLKGKTVIPFVTHGGSRFSESVETIRKLKKDSRVIEGPSVSRRNVPAAEESIKTWLESSGLKK